MLLYLHEEFVMQAHARPTDEPPCALNPNEKAGDHEDTEDLQVAAVGGVAIEADSGDQLDHEHHQQCGQKREIEKTDLPRPPAREQAQHGSTDEQQTDDGDDDSGTAGVEAGDQTEQDDDERIRESSERCGGSNAVNVGGLWAEDPLRSDRDSHKEEADESSRNARARRKELVRGRRRHFQTDIPRDTQALPPSLSAL